MRRRVIIAAGMALAILSVSTAVSGSQAGADEPEALVGSKAGAVVELLLKGFGGAEDVIGTTSLVCHGHAEDTGTGKPGTSSLYILPDGRFRLDLAFGTQSIARVRSGPASYSSINGGILMQVDDAENWRVAFEQKSFGLLFDLLREELRPEYSGMGFSKGKRYDKLVLYDPAGPALTVVLDSKTGQVQRTLMDSGYGRKGIFEMVFSDYRPEGELVLPHSFSEYVGGRLVLKVKLREFAPNTVVSSLLFRP